VPLLFWSEFEGFTGLGFGLGVFLKAEGVGGVEGAGEDVGVGFGEDDVSGTHASPTTGNREKHFRKIVDEELLLLGIEHEVAIALLHVSEGGEDAATDAEVCGAEMGTLFGVGKAEGDAGEVFGSHGGIW